MGCEAAKKPASSVVPQQASSLDGKQWTVEEIGGKPMFENSKATLAFFQADRVAGNGSCNRFMGPAEISGDKIKLGLAGTRMMCGPAMSDQESMYLKTLEGAQRFAVREGCGSDIDNQKLEFLAGAKLTHDISNVTLIGIHFAIEAAHFCFGDFSGQISKSAAQLRKSFERRAPHDGDGVVRGKIMAIVF